MEKNAKTLVKHKRTKKGDISQDGHCLESAGTAREQEREMGLKNDRLTEDPHKGQTYLSPPFSGQPQLEER